MFPLSLPFTHPLTSPGWFVKPLAIGFFSTATNEFIEKRQNKSPFFFQKLGLKATEPFVKGNSGLNQPFLFPL